MISPRKIVTRNPPDKIPRTLTCSCNASHPICPSSPAFTKTPVMPSQFESYVDCKSKYAQTDAMRKMERNPETPNKTMASVRDTKLREHQGIFPYSKHLSDDMSSKTCNATRALFSRLQISALRARLLMSLRILRYLPDPGSSPGVGTTGPDPFCLIRYQLA